ncbi:hypothetical protein GALMADRAFT_133847 [Galerina marginata CBS 339.88]|uniref:Uncharacterized protein n=1 Tax=Galerina marginata (strain CBS 339.88) TaxID=685588 RepID=A0A067TX91_GALM3|nr:hypothetical protein GALMADRAFT_133847 [Galerina marginata CBS 339.88]
MEHAAHVTAGTQEATCSTAEPSPHAPVTVCGPCPEPINAGDTTEAVGSFTTYEYPILPANRESQSRPHELSVPMDDTVDIVHEDETELIEVSGRGRPCRVPKQKFLGECICGNPVSAEEMDDGGQAIICKRAGCETTWSASALSAGSLHGFANLARVAEAKGKGGNEGETLDVLFCGI